jgi:SPP1 gp7 family putative phage head morphogenesis protein
MPIGVDPVGRVVKNLFIVRRLGTTITDEGRVLLDALIEQIVADLHRIDPTAPKLKKWQTFRTEELIRAVRARLRETFPVWEKTIRDGLAVAGRQQGEFAAGTLVTSLGSTAGAGILRNTPITQARVRTIFNTLPFGGAGEQHLLKDWAAGLERSTYQRIVGQIRLGMTYEEGIPEMTRRLRGTSVGYKRAGYELVDGKKVGGRLVHDFRGGVFQKATTKQAEAIVRTAVTFISSKSHLETFRANKGALLGVQYSATLDDRTTDICLSLDGTIWALDSPKIVVPGDTTHVGCRSTLVPVPDYEKFGLEPPPDGYRKARDLSGLEPADLKKKITTRRGEGLLGRQTTVSSKRTAEDWFRDQPAWIQNRQIGKGKAELFRDGRISLKDLVREDNSRVSLRELRERLGP